MFVTAFIVYSVCWKIVPIILVEDKWAIGEKCETHRMLVNIPEIQCDTSMNLIGTVVQAYPFREDQRLSYIKCEKTS